MTLSINNLSKEYNNGVKTLDIKKLEIGNGMFGLLGPNGAGKSSLMRTLATLQPPDTGHIKLDDIDLLNDPYKVRKQLGYLPQEFGVPKGMGAEHLLNHIATVKGISNKSR